MATLGKDIGERKPSHYLTRGIHRKEEMMKEFQKRTRKPGTCGGRIMKLKRNFRRAARLGLILLVIEMPIVMGCRATAGVNSTGYETVAVPDEARLINRIQSYYVAMGSRNVNTMYRMQLPDSRSKMTLEAYERNFENLSAAPPTKMGASVEKICSCRSGVVTDGQKAILCVLLLRVTADKPGGQQWKGLQVWEYLNGEWYYGFSGGGDVCPPPISGE